MRGRNDALIACRDHGDGLIGFDSVIQPALLLCDLRHAGEALCLSYWIRGRLCREMATAPGIRQVRISSWANRFISMFRMTAGRAAQPFIVEKANLPKNLGNLVD